MPNSLTQPCWVDSLTLLPTGKGGTPVVLGKDERWKWLSFSGRVSLVLACAFVFLTSGICRADEVPGAFLHWRNGDKLKGLILPGTGEKIVWKAKWFAEPFTIRSSSLGKISFPEPKTTNEKSGPDHFRFTLLNGDKIFADLLSIDKDNVTITSTRFVEAVTIPRSSLERIENVAGKHLFFPGLTELIDWTSIDGRSKPPKDWFASPTGELSTSYWNGGIFQHINFPEQVEIAFQIQTPYDRPEVDISLTRKPTAGPRLEAWGDTLVLTHGSRFVKIMTLEKNQRNLQLRIFWNQKNGDMKICDQSGKVLATLDKVIVTPAKSKKNDNTDTNQRGFSVTNRTTQLKFTHLSVRKWDGKEIRVIDVEKPRVETINGEILFDLDRLTLAHRENSLSLGRSKVKLTSIAVIVLTPPGTTTAEHSVVSQVDPAKRSLFSWHDGSTFRGELRSIDDRTVIIQSEWSKNPIKARLDRAKEFRFPVVNENPQLPTARITAPGLALQGKLRVGNNSDSLRSLIAWQPVGAENASPLAGGISAVRIVSINYPAMDRIRERDEARLFLTNNEILSGKLLSIGQKAVRFTSKITGEVAIPGENIRAIDLDRTDRILSGFEDKGWTVLQGEDETKAIELMKEKAILKGAAFGHRSILAGDYIRFRCDWKGNYGAMTINLFAGDSDPSSPSFDIVLAAQGTQLFVGELKKGGAFNFSGERVPISGSGANIWIVTHPDKVNVLIDGKPVFSKKLEPDQISGNGLYFRTGGGWPGWNNQNNEVEISRFHINQSPGYVPVLRIDPKAKKNALIIPRFQKKNPATHILIAPNGDVLRGNLVSFGDDMLDFVSKSVPIKLPPSRVAAIIWPKEKEGNITNTQKIDPKKEKVAGKEKAKDPFSSIKIGKLTIPTHQTSHQITLNSGSRLKLAADKVENITLIGQSEILGTCRIPFAEIKEIKSGISAPIVKSAKKETGSYSDWILEYAPEPKIPGGKSGKGDHSPLIGKTAPDFTLAMLDDSKFKLSDYKGKVVVLDFWATWCAPCIKAMPDVTQVVRAFQKSKAEVVLCAVNQAETPAIISAFLEKRRWESLPVALDFNMSVSNSYHVEGIPHTVVIGKNGKIAWMHSGYTKNLKNELAKAVAKELGL